MRSRVRRYQAILQELVDAAPVDLIIARDLAATVDRLEPTATPYIADRGDRGTVGGRTLTHNARPQVILNGSYFVRTTTDGHHELNVDNAKRLTHIVRHEAQHVLIHQRRTGSYGKPATNRAAARFLHDQAARVIDEYRSEAAACRISSAHQTTSPQMLGVLNTLGAGLHTAVGAYQRHLNVHQLRGQVAEAVAAFWVQLGYFAGARKAAGKQLTPPKALIQHPLWTRYAKESWPAVEQLLSLAPPSDAHRTEPSVRSLKRTTREMAALLQTHLLQLGFEMVDEPSGDSFFYIRRSDFPHLPRL